MTSTAPRLPTRSRCRAASFDFYTLESVASVDIYGISPAGHAFSRAGVVAPGLQDLKIDPREKHQVALIPFSAVDSTAAAEKDTGFDLPANAMVSPFVGIKVLSAQSGKTVDFGILSSESGGDADGFGVALSAATAGSVLAKSASTATRGALLGGATLDRGYVVAANSQSVSYTPNAGSTTDNGLLVIPYDLPTAG
jgi:hypothetical protein